MDSQVLPPPRAVDPESADPLGPRSRRSSKRWTIAVVAVLTAALFILTVVSYVMVQSLGPTSGCSWPLDLASSEWDNGTFPVTVHSLPCGEVGSPTVLSHRIVGRTGTEVYSGAAGEMEVFRATIIGVVYEDTTQPGSISVGDTIRVVVAPETHGAVYNCTLQVSVGERALAGFAEIP